MVHVAENLSFPYTHLHGVQIQLLELLQLLRCCCQAIQISICAGDGPLLASHRALVVMQAEQTAQAGNAADQQREQGRMLLGMHAVYYCDFIS